MSKKRIWGIVLLVLCVMAVFGSIVNGSFEQMAGGLTLSNIVTLGVMAAMAVGGIVLIISDR